MTVEPGGPRRVSLAWGFLYILQKVSFKCKENHQAPKPVFCCRGFRLRILTKSWHVSFFNFAVFVFAQGFSWKVAMTGLLDDHCSETFFAFSHKDSLEKSRWQGCIKILAKMHILHSRTRILFKSREGWSFKKAMCASPALKDISFFPQELHTFLKMSHVSIKTTVVNFIGM